MKSEQDKLIKKAKEQVNSFQRDLELDSLKGKIILEIGFKNGLFLKECQDRGVKRAIGTEINYWHYQKTKELFPQLELIYQKKETIPLKDESADYIVSFQVLEHVNSLEKVLHECYRILKPGGMMYHVCPNYNSFYEGHYKIIWWPFLNKDYGRKYLKLIGKYTPYYEGLNIVKPFKLKMALRNFKEIEVVSTGEKEFAKRFNKKQASKLDSGPLRFLVLFFLKVPFLANSLIWFLNRCESHYPIVLIAKKDKLK
jgi:SAM-dependent methyltransferase